MRPVASWVSTRGYFSPRVSNQHDVPCRNIITKSLMRNPGGKTWPPQPSVGGETAPASTLARRRDSAAVPISTVSVHRTQTRLQRADLVYEADFSVNPRLTDTTRVTYRSCLTRQKLMWLTRVDLAPQPRVRH